jgi:hypothetical protein
MEASPDGLRPLGRTGLVVSPVCIGASPLASIPALYGYEVGRDRGEATILARMTEPVRWPRGQRRARHGPIVRTWRRQALSSRPPVHQPQRHRSATG